MNQDRRDFLQDSGRLGAFALINAALWPIEPALAQSGQGRELATMSIVELAQLLASQKIHQPPARRAGAHGYQRSERRRLSHLPQRT